MVNYYTVLGVSSNASDEVIKAAFKQKALIFHPDKNAGDPDFEEKFKLINVAYQTLSNPYERARYDLKLRFGETALDTPPPPRYRPPTSRRPAYGPIDHKTNDKATLWAFGISLGIAVVVMTAMQLFNMYNDYQRNQMLESRRQVFDQAQQYEARGEVVASLAALESLGLFYEEERDMEVFQEEVLDDVLQSGTRHFYQNRFKEAVEDFKVFEQYAFNKRLSFQLLFADAHMLAGNHGEAISRFNQIIIAGNNTIEINLKVAWIYREGLKDYEQAMNYYDIASAMAIRGYKAVFGEAYPLLLGPRNVPPAHFDIFDGIAQTYYRQGNLDRALRAIKWNVIMWPDYPENYVLRGQIYQDQGKLALACNDFNLAVSKGWDSSLACD